MEERRSYQDRRKSDRYEYDNGELYVAFRCANYQFVVENKEVLSVTAPPKFIVIPKCQPWFVGVASINGYVSNVSDLSAYLNLEPALDQESARLLLLNHEDNTFGLLVDAVIGVIECQPCERSRAFYPLEVESFTVSQRCADGQCYDEFDIRRLFHEPGFLNAVEAGEPSVHQDSA